MSSKVLNCVSSVLLPTLEVTPIDSSEAGAASRLSKNILNSSVYYDYCFVAMLSDMLLELFLFNPFVS